MAERRSPPTQQAGRIKDARDRKMTQLDPVTMRLLHQHDVIPAETLRELADEMGVGWSKHVRVVFFITVVCLALVALTWLGMHRRGSCQIASFLLVLLPL